MDNSGKDTYTATRRIGHSRNAAAYRMTMTEFRQQLLPEDYPATTVWGYEGSFSGPTIEARRNKPVAVEWINELPMSHLFPIEMMRPFRVVP